MILAVKDGKIIERGSHAELMAQKGYYHRLYTRQYEDEQTQSVLNKESAQNTYKNVPDECPERGFRPVFAFLIIYRSQ